MNVFLCVCVCVFLEAGMLLAPHTAALEETPAFVWLQHDVKK